MTQDDKNQTEAEWWSTSIIEMAPGVIRYRGYPIEELIGQASFAQMIWLLLRGELPSRDQAALLDIALMAAVDHGPQAPSIAIARMAATCGVGLNNAMASALNVLGDVHGGAGEQALGFYHQIADEMEDGQTMETATANALDAFVTSGGRYLPGFGHRFHPIDPRAPRLLEMVDSYADKGAVSGRFAAIARCLEATLATRKGKTIPMNIDGATAVIYAELGFPPPLARGLFCLSRSVGILAHAWEEMQSGQRNKGPLPRERLWNYDGPTKRPVRISEAG